MLRSYVRITNGIKRLLNFLRSFNPTTKNLNNGQNWLVEAALIEMLPVILFSLLKYLVNECYFVFTIITIIITCDIKKIEQ